MASRRDSIALWKKKEVFDWVNSAGNGIPSRAVSHFRSCGWELDPGTVRRWWRNCEDIWAAKPYQQRLSGGGRKKALGELEDLLLEAIASFNFTHTVWVDETAVYFEDAREQTVQIRGSRHVVVKSTGFASMRVTAVLAITATGVKLPSLVIWKHINGSRKISKVGGTKVAYQPKAWVDSKLLCNWIDTVFPRVLQADGKALVWDSMRVHISKKVKTKSPSAVSRNETRSLQHVVGVADRARCVAWMEDNAVEDGEKGLYGRTVDQFPSLFWATDRRVNLNKARDWWAKRKLHWTTASIVGDIEHWARI
ncbi:uncharacterized protein PITG_12511 [Phytophthora infestans T30-4]|uniref:DDE-1 domain-containing protein n=1 Tax=Phytophthora infestans (strain T30-4) TaxID=403677 RepID=D0NKP8_PHYIT|nr:uncharacterized protein PITG_12511 [Phytophthora infestans T30-4]EEY60184.1 conserved hypothetical protein [Phytophthora infestans T30-4]|eukprot:XP_002900391.1 conserved hypothetical protein [Phytophthora infestans T30-4]